jgi:UDP-2-acetamido-2,6-beta-L-arabino-hexul-4-ose reductase
MWQEDAMKTILITGAKGFVGRNLLAVLERRDDATVLPFDVDSARGALDAGLAACDVVIHLAGVNRPRDTSEFESGNAGFTDVLCGKLETLGRRPAIIFASSIQAELDNPYGVSKRQAEERLKVYAARTGARVVIFRFKNIFGKWCRPNYNSVVATFCHNVAHGMPLAVSDRAKELELVHIDDVVRALVDEVGGRMSGGGDGGPGNVLYAEVSPVYRTTLGVLAETIQGFRASRKTLVLPEVGDRFVYALYSTYLSYLAPEDFGYPLDMKRDARGVLAEFIRVRGGGQMFVSRTEAGVVRGDHFHHLKTEKFLVVEGQAVIRFRRIGSDGVIERPVSGEKWEIIDIPAGYTHAIENIGQAELITLFWASEWFDPARPDTYAEKV